MTTTTWRFPDKPAIELGRAGLSKLPRGYMVQMKADGWRTVLEHTATGWTFTSRHRRPIPISQQLAGDVAEALTLFPVGSILDGEWVARRPAARDENLFLFDVMQYADKPLWHLPTSTRFDMLKLHVSSELIVPHSSGGALPYDYYFDRWRNERPDGEGIVLKMPRAKYIGSCRACANNPGWMKSKWRAGEDGRTILEPQAASV